MAGEKKGGEAKVGRAVSRLPRRTRTLRPPVQLVSDRRRGRIVHSSKLVFVFKHFCSNQKISIAISKNHRVFFSFFLVLIFFFEFTRRFCFSSRFSLKPFDRPKQSHQVRYFDHLV